MLLTTKAPLLLSSICLRVQRCQNGHWNRTRDLLVTSQTSPPPQPRVITSKTYFVSGFEADELHRRQQDGPVEGPRGLWGAFIFKKSRLFVTLKTDQHSRWIIIDRTHIWQFLCWLRCSWSCSFTVMFSLSRKVSESAQPHSKAWKGFVFFLLNFLYRNQKQFLKF